MNLAVVAAAQWNGEFIADLAPECWGLGEPEMVGIARLAAANQASLLGHVSNVVPVTNSARFREGEGALVDCSRDPFGPRPLA